jgi:hypothetical protein
MTPELQLCAINCKNRWSNKAELENITFFVHAHAHDPELCACYGKNSFMICFQKIKHFLLQVSSLTLIGINIVINTEESVPMKS